MVTGNAISQEVFPQKGSREIRLISKMGIVEQQWKTKADFEIRRRSIELNSVMLSPQALSVGDLLNLKFFDDCEYTVTINRVDVDVNSVISIFGKIEGTQHGYFYLSHRNGISLATIEIIESQKRYVITYNKADAMHHVTEIDSQRIEPWKCAPPLIPTKSQ